MYEQCLNKILVVQTAMVAVLKAKFLDCILNCGSSNVLIKSLNSPDIKKCFPSKNKARTFKSVVSSVGYKGDGYRGA